MRVAIHQPQYWPWPRYLHKALDCDVFVYLDTVQFSKNGVQNRNQIKTPQGPLWLTLPVAQHLGQSIREARIADARTTQKHFKSLGANYAKTEGFLRWKAELESCFTQPGQDLCGLAIASTEWMLTKLGAKNRRVRASELSCVRGDLQASKLVAGICSVLGATDYLTGRGALDYMAPADFRAIGCAVWAQSWTAFEYPQYPPGVPFAADLSMLDLLLNCPDQAGSLLRAAGGWELLWKNA
jgi:hypothetical protein